MARDFFIRRKKARKSFKNSGRKRVTRKKTTKRTIKRTTKRATTRRRSTKKVSRRPSTRMSRGEASVLSLFRNIFGGKTIRRTPPRASSFPDSRPGFAKGGFAQGRFREDTRTRQTKRTSRRESPSLGDVADQLFGPDLKRRSVLSPLQAEAMGMTLPEGMAI